MPSKTGQTKISQDFFPRGTNVKTQGFIFNKAPINKKEAKEDTKHLVQEKRNKRSAFMAKLYDDEVLDDEMRVFDMENAENLKDDEVEEVDVKKGKRQLKADDKSQSKSKSKQVYSKNEISKIGKLKFSTGSIGLFAICEIHDDYLIVNYTRNVKGYVPLEGAFEEAGKHFEIGQLIVASVISDGTSQYNVDTSKNQNKKIQLTIDHNVINQLVTIDNINANAFFQGVVESKEAKGYLINFGMKDKSKGFLTLNEDSEGLQIGQIVQVVVKSTIQASKIIKCEILNKTNSIMATQNKNELTMHYIKPGFLVNAKVQQTFDNGIEVEFLQGFTGTIFVDHLEKGDPNKYKMGEKLIARIIFVDPLTKNINLSQLSHIVKMNNIAKIFQQNGISVGKTFEKVKVSRKVFGQSYQVKLNDQASGFLHKIHAVAPLKLKKKKKNKDEEIEQDEEEQKKQPQQEIQELEEGDVLSKVRIKEINYFDGLPILSMRDDILNTNSLTYDSLQVGQFVQAKIEEVNEISKYVILRLNEFVKGKLFIEHMADFPIKVIPPKMKQIGKEIKVRVFYVDSEDRDLEFTKKETLLKAKTPVYQNFKEVKYGQKLVGIVVKENEFGYAIKSFGGIKAFLTHQEIKNAGKGKKDYKVGSIVKGYVLFKKKDKGIGLILDKSKAKEIRKQNKNKENGATENKESSTFDNDFMPSQEEIDQIKLKYKSLIKTSQDPNNVSNVMQFRIVETSNKYFIVKSIDAAKKSHNIVAILPRCLVPNSFVLNLTVQKELSFQGLILEINEISQLPVITSSRILIGLKAQIPHKNEDFEDKKLTSFIGFLCETTKKGVILRFFNGLTKTILYKDLDNTQNISQSYQIGQIIRARPNKSDRLSLKQKVVYYSNLQLNIQDKEIQIQSYYEDLKQSLEIVGIKIGQKIDGTIQLIKDYGLILQIASHQDLTGFIMNEHKNGKNYKEGQKVQCIVMDIDFDKNILDLSEKLASQPKSSQNIVKGSTQKVLVELSKEGYVIFSFKSNRQQLGIIMMQNFNNDHQNNPNENLHIGDELEVKVIQSLDKESGITMAIPNIENTKLVSTQTEKDGGKKNNQLVQGLQINGIIKSIKGQSAFLQLPLQSQLMIGRLHKLECQSSDEFDSLIVGQSIQAKILKVSQGKDFKNLIFTYIDKKKTWIELTRKKKHMSKSQGLDQDTLKDTLMSFDELKDGKSYEALISEVNYQYSQPVQVSLSPFVKSSIYFNKLATIENIVSEGFNYFNRFQGEKIIQVKFIEGKFSVVQDSEKKEKFEKGDLVQVRFVKSVIGKGITVQIDENNYGFIEICEITDEIQGSVLQYASERQIFIARIIDNDKNGKFILSSRESVTDENKWKLLSPSGKSIHFQKFDEKLQKQGNQRNKIIKFGANSALHEGDLCLGYITNIGKSGCFVQIGHNCTVRAALNELSDQTSFNFLQEMPLGRLVLGRITSADEKTGIKRFNFSIRKTLVVYGSNAFDRSQLQEESIVDVIILTVVDDKAFGSIKGSYYKIKVKNFTKEDNLKEGDQVKVKLIKVTKQKIKGAFIEKTDESNLNQEEMIVEKLYLGVQEESQKDIESYQKQKQQQEIDEEVLKRLGTQVQDEVEMQIEDLKELEQDDETVQNDESDLEEMQRIIKESKVYEDDEGKEDEDMDDEVKEISDEDEEEVEKKASKLSKEQSDSEEEKSTSKSGKKSLKARIQEEQTIRKKENQIRENKDQPQSIDDYERLLMSNQDQSYVWIQYMAFMLDKLGMESSRRVAERAVKSVSISNEEDKFNIWIAYMNLENNFGNQKTLESIVKRALEVNDRKKIYLQLISIYQSSQKYQYIEDIFKVLCKKFNTSLKVWSGYLEFLFEMRSLKHNNTAQNKFIVEDLEFSDPKPVLQRALQSLPKEKHVNVISKFGMLEFKNGAPENGRTMFEGIVNNYPKRMDIWSIYMDMEVKYGGKSNIQQARHLFERCLSNDFIQKKPKKMKLVFQKYMEYELAHGNKKNVDKLRERVEEYLDKIYQQDENKDKTDGKIDEKKIKSTKQDDDQEMEVEEEEVSESE